VKFKNVKLGILVKVYDRYRFAKPLYARVIWTSECNDGVKILLLQSNNKAYPVDCETWVHAQQLKQCSMDFEGIKL
jgi:hypothetical protein